MTNNSFSATLHWLLLVNKHLILSGSLCSLIPIWYGKGRVVRMLSVTEHHAMKAYWGLTSMVDSFLIPCDFIFVTYCMDISSLSEALSIINVVTAYIHWLEVV
jgi:uncharacterized membrane-anchored protein